MILVNFDPRFYILFVFIPSMDDLLAMKSDVLLSGSTHAVPDILLSFFYQVQRMQY